MSNIALLRGFDLYFTKLSADSLERIAQQLGGRCSFNVEQGRATYMFEKIKTIECEKVSEIHQIPNEFGNLLAITFGCTFLYSELYLTVTPKGLSEFKNYIA